MGLHPAEARLQPAGATEASDHAISGRQPGAEAQGIHEERGGLGEVQDEYTVSLRRQASGPGVEGAGARAGDRSGGRPGPAEEEARVHDQGKGRPGGAYQDTLRPVAGQVSRDP
jgi:hypothetical protein